MFQRDPLDEIKRTLGAGQKDGPVHNGPVPDWAKEQPTSIAQLLRQLSANAGQSAMPGGMVGAVQTRPFGSGGDARMLTNMTGYGQQPNSGEATFYRQSIKGGMTPVSAVSSLGVPEKWRPFGGGKDDGKNGSPYDKFGEKRLLNIVNSIDKGDNDYSKMSIDDIIALITKIRGGNKGSGNGNGNGNGSGNGGDGNLGPDNNWGLPGDTGGNHW